MIHYDLVCASEHRFDGWFRDSASFDDQAARGLLECPSCGASQVRRALMAPAVPRRRRSARNTAEVEAARAAAPQPAASGGAASPERGVGASNAENAGGALIPAVAPGAAPAVAGSNMPAQLRSMLQKLRAEVEQRCDYVGPSFAETARRMHDGKVAPRGIYGETTPDEAEALRDDGIEVASIPWLPRSDA